MASTHGTLDGTTPVVVIAPPPIGVRKRTVKAAIVSGDAGVTYTLRLRDGALVLPLVVEASDGASPLLWTDKYGTVTLDRPSKLIEAVADKSSQAPFIGEYEDS